MMDAYRFVFGPVPSRRLGNSLGVSPIPPKTCNYSCIYCQLGRTDHMTNRRQAFYPVEEILAEVRHYVEENAPFDIVTIVGEGEPTLYAELGALIRGIKALTDKPVAVITNSALLYDEDVRQDLMAADVVLPSFDAYDPASFRQIDRPYGRLDYQEVYQGLITFSQEFSGQIWLEVMLVAGLNCDETALARLREQLQPIRYDRLYVNTPVRPPAEAYVQPPSPEQVARATEILGGISIDMLSSGQFFSEITDDYQAILSIIRRHPMNQFEVESFLASRHNSAPAQVLQELREDKQVDAVTYKGITSFRHR